MAKKSGFSKKSKDWLGRTVITHCNQKGDQTGYSKPAKDFWGNSITENFNRKGEKTGYNKPANTFLGSDITERRNTKDEKLGHNKKVQTVWGNEVTERYNAAGKKTRHSVKTTTFLGATVTQHYDDSAPSYRHSGHGATGSTGDDSDGTKGAVPAASGSGWLWILAVVIIALCALGSGTFDTLLGGRATPSTPTRLVKPYEATKLISQDTQAGFTTIDATADAIGTLERGGFTIITGGTNQQVFLQKKYPDIDIGDRLRITYDPHVPERLQGPAGTAASMSGMILSFVILRHNESISQSEEPAPSGARIEKNRLLPVDGGLEDSIFSAFRTELLAAIARKDSQFLLSVLAPDIEIGFGGEPNTSSEFDRVWKLESPDSPIWAGLDTVLKLGGSFETRNNERTFCAPYLCRAWPQRFDPERYVALITSDAPLKSGPDHHSESLARLSYNVLRFVAVTPDRKWVHVRLPNGTEGFVQGEYVRSPFDRRAVFKKRNGKWVMSAYVAGD